MAGEPFDADPRVIGGREKEQVAITISPSGQAVAPIPKVEIALITGSANWGLRFPEDIGLPGVTVVARDVAFETQYGVSENWKLFEFDGSLTPEGTARRALCMYSHGNPRDWINHSCHRRAFAVLQAAGVSYSNGMIFTNSRTVPAA